MTNMRFVSALLVGFTTVVSSKFNFCQTYWASSFVNLSWTGGECAHRPTLLYPIYLQCLPYNWPIKKSVKKVFTPLRENTLYNYYWVFNCIIYEVSSTFVFQTWIGLFWTYIPPDFKTSLRRSSPQSFSSKLWQKFLKKIFSVTKRQKSHSKLMFKVNPNFNIIQKENVINFTQPITNYFIIALGQPLKFVLLKDNSHKKNK